jgi:hypothetical protein
MNLLVKKTIHTTVGLSLSSWERLLAPSLSRQGKAHAHAHAIEHATMESTES